VLLGLFSLLGRACLDLLDGMFAFVVYDLLDRSVFLARDRFGEKPLYWLQSGQRFAFASELKALRKLTPSGSWSYDRASLALFHLIGSIPAPRTVYSGMASLAPASWIHVDAQGRVAQGIYWSAVQHATVRHAADRALAVEGVKARMQHAVASRMVSDVP
jgi:asparagine synthase (glutamine-hydrolysing)